MAEGRSIYDWQSEQSMNKYLKKEKPYQKQEQFPKPHHKDKWVQDELPFGDKPWRERSLTDTEIEELFWAELVQLGWKWQAYGNQSDRKNLVLPCPYCDLVIDSHTIITESNAKKMKDKNYCEQILRKHKGLECKAILED